MTPYAEILAVAERIASVFDDIPVRYEVGPEMLATLRGLAPPPHDPAVALPLSPMAGAPVFVVLVLAPYAWQAVNGRDDVIAGSP